MSDSDTQNLAILLPDASVAVYSRHQDTLASAKEVVNDWRFARVKIETYERPTTKTVEMVSKVPKDMLEHIDAIFTERDAIRDRTVRADRTLDPDSVITRDFYNEIERDKGAPWWPTLNAIILPYAIEAVRHRLKESTS